jgi:hypothetical protein
LNDMYILEPDTYKQMGSSLIIFHLCVSVEIALYVVHLKRYLNKELFLKYKNFQHRKIGE